MSSIAQAPGSARGNKSQRSSVPVLDQLQSMEDERRKSTKVQFDQSACDAADNIEGSPEQLREVIDAAEECKPMAAMLGDASRKLTKLEQRFEAQEAAKQGCTPRAVHDQRRVVRRMALTSWGDRTRFSPSNGRNFEPIRIASNAVGNAEPQRRVTNMIQRAVRVADPVRGAQHETVYGTPPPPIGSSQENREKGGGACSPKNSYICGVKLGTTAPPGGGGRGHVRGRLGSVGVKRKWQCWRGRSGRRSLPRLAGTGRWATNRGVRVGLGTAGRCTSLNRLSMAEVNGRSPEITGRINKRFRIRRVVFDSET